jgi:hypothetical protein
MSHRVPKVSVFRRNPISGCLYLVSVIGLFVAIAGMIGTGSALAAQSVEISIIVKDTTSFYWQVVFAGGRKAGKELGVKIPELGAQSESDINGQISILENTVSEKPAAQDRQSRRGRMTERLLCCRETLIREFRAER